MEESKSFQFFKGLSIQTIITISTALLQLMVFAIFSRLLSREDFGYYAAVTGVISILTSISDAGIGSSVIQRKEATEKYRSTAFTLSVIIGLLIAIVAFLLSPFISTLIADSYIITPLKCLSVTIFLYSLQSYAVATLKRELEFKKVGTCKIISYAIASAVGISLAYFGFGLYALVFMTLLDTSVYTILLYIQIKIPNIKFSREDSKQIISFGGWLTLGVIVTSISNQLDKIILGRRIGVQSLGEYNRPAGFIQNSIGLVNTIFDTVLFSMLSQFQDSKKHFNDLLTRSSCLLSNLGSILAAMLFFNSTLIITIFFGSKWLDLLPVLRILSIGAIFMLFNTLADCFFRSFNMVRVGFIIRLIGLGLWISAIFIATRFGIQGVALAVLSSNFLIVVLKLLYLCRVSNLSILSFIVKLIKSWKPSIPIMFVGLLFYFTPINLNYMITQLIVMLIVLALELIYLPGLFGSEYQNLLYPRIVKK